MCAGRFVIGLGSARLINRNYILEYVPKARIAKYLLRFQIASLSGIASGPLFALIILFIGNVNFSKPNIFNDYTNPVWFTMLLSFVLLFMIICLYTEPLQSNFNMFKGNNQGLDESFSSSSISKETMSKKDKIMIEQIDDKLSEINDKNQFSDTNLVSRSIEQIAWKEKKTNSYTYRCFIVFIFILFVVRVYNKY